MDNIKNKKSSNDKTQSKSDFDFLLWKIGLNTELLSFWKSITNSEKD